MTYNIDSETYDKLYARYLRGNRTKEMVDLAGNLRGKRVLDFCSGGCRLSEEVLKRKAKTITAVDESFKMLQPIVPYKIPGDSPINKICLSIEDALTDLSWGQIDAIFCQQGVNYWFAPKHARIIKKVLAPKGMFIFNTFNVKPSINPRIKSYYYEKTGLNYTEISWLVGDMVKHVQIVQGMDPHFTEFRWIPPEEFKKALKLAGFKVTIQTDKATDIYICRKG
jgi:SAM-dependent methyltransferase